MQQGISYSAEAVTPRSSAIDHQAIGDFSGLYETQSPGIRKFLGCAGVPAASADDLTQEVFLRAWACRVRFVPKASVKTWLFAIARNVVLEWRRRRPAPMPVDAELPVADTVTQAIAHRECTQAVRKAVRQLPPKQHQAIQLVYYDGMKPAQAASTIGCEEQVFCRRLADARATLRRLLGSSQTEKSGGRAGP
ncbi:MAG: sigma-70 family RNA polymerase sigma factor [Planctomycetota bacterium]|nr:sigma-70 family RNA polymerase sigma factor [Planctomycetota bacterium]